MNDATDRAQLAADTIYERPTRGIPTWLVHLMQHEHIERVAGAAPGDYRRDPEGVYLACQHAAGVCFIDQFIPENPLSMGDHGFEKAQRGATTGAERIERDGIVIDSPEATVEHLERVAFPQLRRAAEAFDEDARTRQILDHERAVQQRMGPSILKTGHAFVSFPAMAYGLYGYANYFMAWALYPEVIERHFSLQADVAVRNNRAAARAYAEGDLPPMYRLDHDMTDSRGPLVSIESLDKLWYPHFARALEPMRRTDVRMLWHCDGNVMPMIPGLLACGIGGFQGFQYEDGVDYERICRMKSAKGEALFIIAGSSVTRTLPMGTPADVKQELDWLVEAGPKTGLFLGCSSSVAPGVPWENIRTLIEGLTYYRTQGRAGTRTSVRVSQSEPERGSP